LPGPIRGNPPPPPPGARRASPPPLPSGAARPLIAPPVSHLTVSQLVKSFSLETLTKAVNIVSKDIGGLHYQRPASYLGPGGLVIHDGKIDVLAVGDGHGNCARLDKLLAKVGAQLHAGQLELLFNGDLIHPENRQNLTEMNSSLQYLKAVIALKVMYPDRVHINQGNHDILFTNKGILEAVVDYTFRVPNPVNDYESQLPLMQHVLQRARVTESDLRGFLGKRDLEEKEYSQGLFFLSALCHELKAEGRTPQQVYDAVSQYQSFMEDLPIAFVIKGSQKAAFIAHAGVVAGGVTQAEIIEGRINGTDFSLLWNYINKHYNKQDVSAMQTKLALTEDPNDTMIFGSHIRHPEVTNWFLVPYPGTNYAIFHGNVPGSYGGILFRDAVPERFEVEVAGTAAAAAA